MKFKDLFVSKAFAEIEASHKRQIALLEDILEEVRGLNNSTHSISRSVTPTQSAKADRIVRAPQQASGLPFFFANDVQQVMR